MRAQLASLFMLLLLSGCLGGDPPTAAQDDAPEASGTSAAPPPSEPAAPPPEPAAVAGASWTNISGTVEMSVAVGLACPKEEGVGPCQAGRLVGHAVEVPRAAPARAVLSATWNATTPAAQTLRFYWRSESAEITAASTSPFTMHVPPEMIPAPGEYVVVVRPDSPGATVDEVVRFTLALEYA